MAKKNLYMPFLTLKLVYAFLDTHVNACFVSAEAANFIPPKGVS